MRKRSGACRREAERRFSSRAMAEGDEQVYRRLIAEHQAEELGISMGAKSSRLPISA